MKLLYNEVTLLQKCLENSLKIKMSSKLLIRKALRRIPGNRHTYIVNL